MDIDYDILAQKVCDEMERRQKGLPSENKRFRRRSRELLTENYIPPESGAPLVTQSEYEYLVSQNLAKRDQARLHRG